MSATSGMPDRRIAPLHERENMKQNLQILENDEKMESKEFSRELRKLFSQELEGKKSVNRRQIDRMRKVLDLGSPDSLSDAEIKKLEAEEKALIPEVQKMMLPKSFTVLTPNDKSGFSTEFRKAANHMAANEFSKEYLKKAHRLKNIRRQLRPDDPDAGNLEFIRPNN